MALARRQVLSIGAALAVTFGTSSCRSGVSGATAGSPPTDLPRVSPTASTTPAPTPGLLSFPGQPPPGSLYYGASVPHGRSLVAWERQLGVSLALNRSYFTPDRNETIQLVQRCRDDLAHHRLPHVSIKLPVTWREVASGVSDAWLAGLLRPLGDEGGPVFLTLHHEPENDAGAPGMQAADYVAMQEHAIGLAAGLAPDVTIVPVLQQWTFDPVRKDIDPTAWLVPDAPVIGLDIYNPWSPTNGLEWRSFGSKADEAMTLIGNKMIAVGEYGCREDPSNPGLAAEWMRDAVSYATTHDIVSMSYFNSGVGAEDGSWRLGGDAERAFADLLAAPWVVRP